MSAAVRVGAGARLVYDGESVTMMATAAGRSCSEPRRTVRFAASPSESCGGPAGGAAVSPLE